MNVFTRDSWLARFFSLVGDLVILHVLWLIFSLPVITIGASTTALYYCAMKRFRRNEGYAWRNFLTSFRENLLQSTIIWILMLLIGAILFTDIRIGMAATSPILGKAMIAGNAFLIIPYILTCLYIFPVQAKFRNPILKNLKNALLMGIANLGHTLVLLLLWATFILLTLTQTFFIGLLLCIGAGFIGYFTGAIYVSVFRKYLPDEMPEDAEASGMDRVEF